MRRQPVLVFLFTAVLSLAGCNMPINRIQPTSIPPTQMPTPSAEPAATIPMVITHKDEPGGPVGKVYQTVHDQVDENTAPKKEAYGGDDFSLGKYERPFDQKMNYMPLVDIVTVQMSREDPLWIYVLIKVDRPFASVPSAQPHYMVELDTNLDNRGDYLIVTGKPKSTEWSTDSVLVFTAPDFNIGGKVAVKPDPELSEGAGYYEEIFNNGRGEDPDLAWSKFSRVDPSVVLIAFKNSMVGGEKGGFVWLPWADEGIPNWSLFDFNDHFTLEQAGFPIKTDMKNYPLKALWGIDNTCRMPSGFKPDKTLIGLCPDYSPPPSSGRSPTDVPPPPGIMAPD
jgi:hypothetical protein